ncbi:MAG: hypothetical protein SFT81_02300 [Candidatus Caenarcaniphilales bacterium]|nr:hypothetical protein [Candidatus Caenarcaniphilales bacterium]
MGANLYLEIKKQIEKEPPDHLFEDLALEVFAYQLSRCKSYSRQVEAQGNLHPKHWTKIPLISTDLYKYTQVFSADEKIVKTFRSSGTTQKDRSQHFLSQHELDLYEASLWKTFSAAFDLESGRKIKYLVLAEGPRLCPESSLNHMFETIRLRLQAEDTCYLIDSQGLRIDRLTQALDQNPGTPALLVGTAFAFVYLLESGLKSLCLPAGSALMETGGFKGLGRELTRKDLYRQLSKFFCLPEEAIVGQYGMSETGTQFYDTSFHSQSSSPHHRWKKTPPWCKTRILDPTDLNREVGVGEVGLIALYDLVNLDSCAFLLTGDLAILRSEGVFELIGRAPKINLKGCSIRDERRF